MKFLITIIIISISFSLSAYLEKKYIYKINNQIIVQSNEDNNTEDNNNIDSNCYQAEIGTVGKWSGCNNLLIVDRSILEDLIDGIQFIASNGEIFNSYSDTKIFTGQVKDFSRLFSHQDIPNNISISNWDVSRVTDMSGLFNSSTNFNQPLNQWNVSNVKDMSGLFYNAESFNQPLNQWNVSSVIDMKRMFSSAESFNQPLNQWNVSNVTNMNSMFRNTPYNNPLDQWDVNNVTNMGSMFLRASSFNQDISNWCVNLIPEKPNSFDSGSGFEGIDKKQPTWGPCP